jgi:hypothetical protein
MIYCLLYIEVRERSIRYILILYCDHEFVFSFMSLECVILIVKP